MQRESNQFFYNLFDCHFINLLFLEGIVNGGAEHKIRNKGTVTVYYFLIS